VRDDRPVSTPALTPTTISDLVERHGVRRSRALGQHFLADPNTARRIVRLAGVAPGDAVLEIGPGVGSLTVALAAAGAEVTALELDRYLLPVLEEVLAGTAVRVVAGDALTDDLGALLPPREGGWKLVANLPYNVATPIVARVLDHVPAVTRVLVMVQREVGERLAAAPGGRDYGAVTVKVAFHGTARVVGAVPRTVFVPPPNVDSVLVEIVRHAVPPVEVPSPEALFTLVRAGFAQRRKMLRSALRPVLGERTVAVIEAAGVDPRARAEAVDLAGWSAISRAAAA
jgi:16S rRNA (adenine1518-N6/adenine1519-N6)-dimethyltransferase